jgi:hypothetical protein
MPPTSPDDTMGFHSTALRGLVADFFCSVGYAAENIHSGMIAYLCDLWNEGEREPLRAFLGRLWSATGDRSRSPC